MEMFGPMIGAAGGIASALIGSRAQHEASVTNYMIAMMNYYQRQREQYEAVSEARRIEHKKDQGFTDSMGTTTKYVPGQGWVVNLGPEAAALQQRELGERMLQLGHDQTIKRQALDRNASRSIQEGDRANALFDQIRRTQPTNPDALERTLFGAQAQGINRGYDDTTATLTKQALRTRASNGGEILKTLARSRATDLGDAQMKARTTAKEMAPQIDNSKRSADANLYNMFATRAAAMPDVSFAPSNVSENANKQLSTAATLGNESDKYRFAAASMEGPRFPYQPPNYGPANAFGAIGQSVGNFFNQKTANDRYNALIDEIRKSTRSNSGDFIQ